MAVEKEIEALRAEIAKVERGQWVATTLHDMASAAKALIAKVEFEASAVPKGEPKAGDEL